jgi:hypothetical protein
MGTVQAAQQQVPASHSAHRAQRLPSVANPRTEEPDAGDLHVRLCGSPGAKIPGPPDYADETRGSLRLSIAVTHAQPRARTDRA